MKKIAIAIVVMSLMAAVVGAQTTPPIKENAFQLYGMVSGWSVDKLSNLNGGVKIGTILCLDKDKGLFVRGGYSSYNLKESPAIQSLDLMPTLTFYIGRKWSLWASGGITGYIGGENSGIDATGGLGAGRRLWTEPNPVKASPAYLDLFGELLVTQARGQITGGYTQVNIGLKFGVAE
jgi:hypothetical protein